MGFLNCKTMKFITCLFFFLTFAFAYSQTEISGTITNSDNKPVPNVSVTLLKVADSAVVAYCIGNLNGEYIIYYSGQEQDLLLCVYSFNIRRQMKKISNKTQTVDFVVIEEPIKLKEVAIKTDKIWGNKDTINYIVDAFRDSTDIVIADVLKKMPGIDVQESGKIEYRGKPISKFYIENMDMLQGRYGIATNNISAADVATVQVLENHQHIKALNDEFTDDVAINLKLKPDAKGTYAIMADIAAGIDFEKEFLWNGGLTGMYFGKKRQQIISYKTNNTGNDIYREFQSFNEYNDYVPTFTGMVIPSPPQINKNRYYFNQGHGITFSALQKTKNDDEFTINLIGYHDIDNRNSNAVTTYIIPETDTISISEKLSSHSTINKLEGDLVYNRNKEVNYLKNTLKFTGSWENSVGSVMNDELIDQTFKLKTLQATNHLILIKRSENKKGFELNSNTSYQLQPHQLTVSPGVFADIINDSLSYNAVKQNVLFSSFETKNGMRFLSSLVWKSLRINPALFASFEHQTLNSEISKSLTENDFILLTNNSFQNDLSWLRAKAGFGLNFEMNHRGFNFHLTTPLQYQYISLTGDVEKHPQQHKILFQPILYLRYIFTSRWEISSSWNFYNTNPNLSTLYSGYILQNYRTLSCYQNDLTDSYGNSASLKLAHKNIMEFFFADVSLTYSNYHNKVMYAQEFENSAMKISLVEIESNGDYLGINGRINKGFNWKKSSFNLAGSWGKGSSPILRQGQLIKYINQGINSNLTASLAITKKIGFADKLSWSRIAGNTDDGTKLDPMHNIINAATVDFTILNNLILSASHEFYYIKNTETQHDFNLFDVSLMYKIKRVRLYLDWNNIFNTQHYVYSYYGSLNTYYSEYLIRPSSIMLRAQFKIY